MPIHDTFSRTSRLIAIKLGMEHWGLGLMIVLSINDPRLDMHYAKVIKINILVNDT